MKDVIKLEKSRQLDKQCSYTDSHTFRPENMSNTVTSRRQQTTTWAKMLQLPPLIVLKFVLKTLSTLFYLSLISYENMENLTIFRTLSRYSGRIYLEFAIQLGSIRSQEEMNIFEQHSQDLIYRMDTSDP